MARCKSCGAKIIWATTKNGKKIPVDAEAVLDGNIRIERGIAYVVNDGDRVSHFATCPRAKEHRR